MDTIAFGILCGLGVLMALGIQCERHLKRIGAALESRQPSGAKLNTVAPAAPIPASQPSGPVPLVHSFSGDAGRAPEMEILRRSGDEWVCLGNWQVGHPDLEHGKRKGFAIRRDGVIEEGTE